MSGSGRGGKPRNHAGNDPELTYHLYVVEEEVCMRLSLSKVSWTFSSLAAKENFSFSSRNEDEFVPSVKQSQAFNVSNSLSNKHDSLELHLLCRRWAVHTAVMGTLDRASIPFGLFPNGMLRSPRQAGCCRAGRCRMQYKSEQKPPSLVRAHLFAWDAVLDTLPSGGGRIFGD